jgi:hypothetical protein
VPYVAPTVSDFKTRFPEFVSDADTRVQIFLDEASLHVDTSWLEQDYQRAIMYLAAHLLLGERAAIATGGGVVQSESFGGEISKTYKLDDDATGLGSTVYGRRYRELLRLNRPGPLVV